VSGEPLASHDGKIAATVMKIKNTTDSHTPGRKPVRRRGRAETSIPGPTVNASVMDVTIGASEIRGTV
jgi:hypothetical protein